MRLTSLQLIILTLVVFSFVSLGSWLPGCSRSARNAPTALDPAPAAGAAGGALKKGTSVEHVQEYVLKGEVRKVEKEAREVTLWHEAIPGFMEAMTMPFHIENSSILDDIRAGDQV